MNLDEGQREEKRRERRWRW